MSVSFDYELELLLESENVCRLCLNTNAVVNIKNYEKSLKSSLQQQILELIDINLSNETILDKICLSCNDKIQDFLSFKYKCKDVDEKLKSLINKPKYDSIELIKHENEEHKCINDTNELPNTIDDLNADTASDTEPLIKIARTKKRIRKNSKQKQEISPFYCVFCHRDLMEDKDFKAHNAKLHEIINGQYQCHGCKKLFGSHQSRYIHERKSCKLLGKGYKCLVCENSLSSRRLLEKHMRDHENEELPKIKCKEIFEMKDKLLRHALQAHHKKFVCESCGCVFRRQDYLHKHKLIHTGVKRHACPHCHMRFIQRSGLTVHIRKHTGERPFKCDMCPHRCVTSSNLREHRRRHQGDKRHQCTICDRKFGYKRSLEEHVASVHERSLPHPCAHCGANYTNKRGLRRHVLAKHADAQLAGDSSKVETEKNNCQQSVWSDKLNGVQKIDSMKIICNEII